MRQMADGLCVFLFFCFEIYSCLLVLFLCFFYYFFIFRGGVGEVDLIMACAFDSKTYIIGSGLLIKFKTR